MEFFQDFGLFLAKTLTLVVAALVLFSAFAALMGRERDREREQLLVKRLNDRYRDMERTIRHGMLGRRAGRRLLRQFKRETKQADKERDENRPRVFVLRFRGDIRASHVDNLRQEITAILTQARSGTDRAVVCLDSGGGLVASYGLAAAQLARLRDRKIELTVAVDRIAASGGYLMAAVANRIVAAPFAVVGSIGVVAQIPNVNRLLKRHDVDIELHTAGQFKRTLTVLGENTPEGREKFRQELEETHQLFKGYLKRYRPQLDLEKLATGEHWYGEQALPLGLVDELGTSDDLLMDMARDYDLYEIRYSKRQPLSRRITLAFESALDRVLWRNTP
ncbi:protease SohB [Thioalkalivibrio denitrificans]|uniref:Protease SohB n=1 Tax=Thioalkalivibrio denitrificans TaxID=108003 RepID=A0A1V3NJW0_9GAMM|nr:protease SohB [Thioalkalivibrio denitrificans]OOG25233.1 protease SohB [Thioalkalivibrio denitrificans]